MTYLFGELWFLLLLAFAAGSLLAWLVAKIALPHEDELESETGTSARGLLS